MITIDTVYPCVKCGEEIDPTHAHCEFCGAKQPEVNTKLHYNVFSQWAGRKAYNMRYGGWPILSIEDISDLASQDCCGSTQYFVGAYFVSGQDQSEEESEFKIDHWYKVTNGQLGPDLGPQKITLTFLE